MKQTKLFILLLAIACLALQISPASTEIINQETFDIRVINDESQEYNIELHIQGPLEEHLSLSEHAFSLSPSEQKTIQVTVNRPIQLSPGIHQSQIVVSREASQEQGTIRSTPSVVHTINYLQPREGIHLTSRLSTSSIFVEAAASFNLHVRNVGTQQANNIQSRIQILEGSNTLHQEEFTLSTLESGQQQRVSTQWTPQQAGEYEVRTQVTHEETVLETSDTFTVGSRSLEVLSINHTVIGETTRVDIELNNTYNRPYNQLQAQITTPTHSAQTASIRLEPGIPQTISGFIEAVYEEDTTAQITINYPPNKLRTQYEIQATTDTRSIPWLLILGILTLIMLIYLRLRTLNKRGDYEQ